MCCFFFLCFGQQNATGLAVGRCWKGMGFLEGFWVETYGDFCLEIWLEWYGNIVCFQNTNWLQASTTKQSRTNKRLQCFLFCDETTYFTPFFFWKTSFPLLGTQIRCRCGCFETFHFSIGMLSRSHPGGLNDRWVNKLHGTYTGPWRGNHVKHPTSFPRIEWLWWAEHRSFRRNWPTYLESEGWKFWKNKGRCFFLVHRGGGGDGGGGGGGGVCMVQINS